MFRMRLVVICCNYIRGMDRDRRPIHHPVKAAFGRGKTMEQVPMFPTAHQIHARAPASALPQRTWAPWGQKCPTYSGIVLVEKWSSSSSAYGILRHLTTWSSRLSAPCIGHATSVVSEATECPCMMISAKLRARRFHACPEDPDLCRLCRLCRSRPDTNSGVDASCSVDELKNLRACTAARAESITKFAACGSSRVSPSCGYVSVARTSRDERCVDPGGGRRSRIILLPSNLP